MSLGGPEILVVLLLALVVFGPKRLPEVGRQVGGALRELRKVQDTVHEELRGVLDDTTAPFHKMLANDDEPYPQEPDLGDEKPGDVEPGDTKPIDGLSGGTFS